jgi:peptide/nickel transport system substrate-binding protein
MEMKKVIVLFFVVLTLTTFNVYAGGEQEVGGDEQPEQVLKIAATADFKEFHTTPGQHGGPSQLSTCLFDGLVFVPGTLEELKRNEYRPGLAESWEVSEDGRTWTFKLRKGVQFHHGYGEFTAEDVAFTYGVVNADPSWGEGNHQEYSNLEFEIEDDYTIRIITPNPDPFFLAMVADVAGGNIISKKAYEERGDREFKHNPIGTGPFQFVEHIPNEKVILERNEKYWQGTPNLERIEFIEMEVSSAELALRKGSVQFLNSGIETQQWVEKIRNYDTVDPILVSREVIAFLQLDTEVEPLDDIRVRRAVHHAIDKDEIIQLYGADLARELKGPVPETFFGGTYDIPQYAYNPDKAKELLAEAGYAEGFAVDVISTERTTILDLMLVIQDQLKRVGIELNVEVLPHSTWHELMREGKGAMNIRNTGRLPFADIILTENYHGDAIVTKETGVTNFMNYDNPLVNGNIKAARSVTDKDRQLELYKETLTQIMEDAVAVPLVIRKSVLARHKSFDPGYEIEGLYQVDGHLEIDHRARIVAE